MARPLDKVSMAAAVALAAGAAAAQPSPDASSPFWDPLVVTPGGQPMRVSESPSTTFVITGAELRRSGAPSLTEALRRVPGLDVRSITAVDGQVGPRGFAYEVSDRVLVMIDGRTVFIDFFGGTAWEMLPVSLLDVEQVEIVLGPGASVYGNKAMLGTINVITRAAEDYPFAEARLDAATPGDGRAAFRVGTLHGDWRYRATALARALTLFPPAGDTRSGAWGATLSAAWSPSTATEVGLEAGVMTGDVHMIPLGNRVDEFEATLGYLRARVRRGLGGPGSPLGNLHLDLVWNTGRIRSPTFPDATGTFRAAFETPYADLHHVLRTQLLGIPLHLRWGGEVRLNTLDSTITSGERALWNVAAYASDELLLGRWRITTGLRVDRATLGRTSVSPRISVVWSPVEEHQLRAAFNTGYNDPHHLHGFADFDAGGGLRVTGNRKLSAEHVRYGEVGWGGRLAGGLRGFATAFAYRFEDWFSLDPSQETAAGIPWGNNDPFTAWGGEAGLEFTFQRALSAHASWAWVDTLGSGVYPYSVDPTGSPRHKVGGGLRWNLEKGPYLDVAAQWFGPSEIARLSDAPTTPNPFVKSSLDGFMTLHARTGWAFRNGFDLSVAVSNLLDDDTVQFPGAERPERRAMATLAHYH